MAQAFIPDDKNARLARSFLPDPTKTNDGPVAVVIVKDEPYRFHLASAGRSTVWKRVAAFGMQRCARQTCTNEFYIAYDAPMATIKKLYCCHTCRGRASEARAVSTRTAPFDAVTQTTSAARTYVAPAAVAKKPRRSKSSSVVPFTF